MLVHLGDGTSKIASRDKTKNEKRPVPVTRNGALDDQPTLLRDVFHAVVTAHDGQVGPQRHLDVGVPQPHGHDVERNPPTISQCRAALCRKL